MASLVVDPETQLQPDANEPHSSYNCAGGFAKPGVMDSSTEDEGLMP